MQIVPAKNYVLLKPLGEVKNKSGLYTPEVQEKKPELGRVFKIGKGILPVPLKINDIVVFKKYMANEITIDNEKINPIAFEDIVAVVKEK